jgi:rhamnulokinase
MGLWLLQRVLKEQNVSDLQALIARTAALPACRFVIDCNDDRFINPASMSAEIQAACREPGSRFLIATPSWRAAFSTAWRCSTPGCLTSWRRCAASRSASCIFVGGGCQNELLNQLCADACGITVVAGPIEASTLGNIGIQLMTLDELANVDEFRQVVRQRGAHHLYPQS